MNGGGGCTAVRMYLTLQTVYLEKGSDGKFYRMYILTQSILKEVLFIYLFRLPGSSLFCGGMAVASPDVAHGLWHVARGNFPDHILNQCALH